MFYNVGAGWNNSSYPGAWMIRPIVSEDEIIWSSVNETSNNFLIYPNPAKEELTIILSTANNLISIYSSKNTISDSDFDFSGEIVDLLPYLLNEKKKIF